MNKRKSLVKSIITERKRNSENSKLDQEKLIIEKSGYFDKKYYTNSYPDIVDSGMDPLVHFTKHGAFEDRNPSALFDTNYYLRRHPEVKMHGANPLIDYLEKLKADNTLKYAYTERSYDKYVKDIINTYCDDVYLGLVKDAMHASRIIVMMSVPWESSLQQRPHHLAKLLAKHGIPVVYIDATISYPRKAQDKLYLLPQLKNLDLLQSRKGIENKYFWLFSTQDIAQSEVFQLKKRGYSIIYDYIDEIDESIAIGGGIKNQLDNFKSIDKIKPTIAIASAKMLINQLQTKVPLNNILLCPNAVDIKHFKIDNKKSGIHVPTDLKNIIATKKPTVGYYGAIAPWLDYRLINNLAKKRKDLNFVFIGLDYNNALQKLERSDNVYFLGPKEYSKLPKYSYWFDCAIIPFATGKVAKATSPVKLFEYMAMGVPTVCTKDLNECRGYDHVYISSTLNEFEMNIDKAIAIRHNKQVQEKLFDQARQNTWTARVDLIINAINKLETKE